MLYELVTVYDNRLQSLKSQIKLNEAVFGKRQGKTWMEENNYIKHPYTTPMLCIAGQRTILARGLTGSVENNINVSEIIKLFFGLWRK